MLTIIRPETPGKGVWTSDRRIYLDKDGNAVEAKDPARVSLLVAAGCTLPMETARRYGLVKDVVPEVAPVSMAPIAESEPVETAPEPEPIVGVAPMPEPKQVKAKPAAKKSKK